MGYTNKTILCLDDEPDNLDAIERWLRKKYHVLKSTSPDEALQLLHQNPHIALIMSDQRMPQMTGVDFFAKVLEMNPRPIRVLLTGYADITSVIEAINTAQIYRYIAKPWDPHELILSVDQCIETYDLREDLKIKNQELEKAIQELKSLDAHKNQFMILINHELKTPLTSLLSFTELLKETKLDEEQWHFLQRIAKSSQKLKNIVDDVLLIMRAQMSQLKVDSSSVVIQDLYKQLDPLLAQEAEKKQVTLRFSNLDLATTGDRRVLTEILNRLLNNAIKFAYPSTEVSVHYENSTFTVLNRGPHIKNDILQKITQPFYLDENIMNHSTGLGLGLSISQALLKVLGSELQIMNFGDGVKVSFELNSSQ